MSENVTQELAKTAFGELSVAQPTPVVQIYSQYGLREDVQTLVAEGGTTSALDSNFVLSTGTNAAGLSTILSEKQVVYKAGQGIMCRITALFTTGVANSRQLAGFINAEDAFAFGFNGTDFSILHARNGVTEIQDLQVTTPAAGAEDAIITVGGTGFTVPLTAGTVQHNAFEIANSLNSQVENHTFTSNDDTVTSLHGLPGPEGSFAFTSATAVAAWTQIAAGVLTTDIYTAQTDWDNPPDFAFDPTKGNVFQIKVQYLGYGGITFFIEDPETSLPILVHTIKYANTATTPSVSNPTFRIGWVAQNQGNTSDLTVKGASAGGFLEGKEHRDERNRTASITATGIGTTRNTLMVIRNRSTFNNKINRVPIYPTLLIIGTDTTKAAEIHLDIGNTFGGDLDFSFIDEINSVVEIATDNVTTVDGRQVATIRLRSVAPLVLDMQKVLEILLPREELTISGNITSGAASEIDISLIWQEDS